MFSSEWIKAVPVGRTPQRLASRRWCTESVSAPGPSLGARPGELQQQEQGTTISPLWDPGGPQPQTGPRGPYLFETAGHQSLCPQRGAGGTCPGSPECRKPRCPRTEPRQLGRPLWSLVTCQEEADEDYLLDSPQNQRGGIHQRTVGVASPPRNYWLTLSGSQNHRWGPRQFCLQQCFSGSCASDHYQKHLQKQQKPDCPSALGRTAPAQGLHSGSLGY